MATTTIKKTATTSKPKAKKLTEKNGNGAKKLNKCGEWMLSMEGKKGYVTILDMNAVLRKY